MVKFHGEMKILEILMKMVISATLEFAPILSDLLGMREWLGHQECKN